MSNDKITEAYSEALESADVIPMTSEELFRLGWQAALTQQPESEPAEYQHRMRPVWDAEEKVWAICRGGHWLHTAHWETLATEYSRENFTHWMPTGLQRPEPPEKGQ